MKDNFVPLIIYKNEKRRRREGENYTSPPPHLQHHVVNQHTQLPASTPTQHVHIPPRMQNLNNDEINCRTNNSNIDSNFCDEQTNQHSSKKNLSINICADSRNLSPQLKNQHEEQIITLLKTSKNLLHFFSRFHNNSHQLNEHNVKIILDHHANLNMETPLALLTSLMNHTTFGENEIKFWGSCLISYFKFQSIDAFHLIFKSIDQLDWQSLVETERNNILSELKKSISFAGNHKIKVAEDIMKILHNFQIFDLHGPYFSQLFKNGQRPIIKQKFSYLDENEKYEILFSIFKENVCTAEEYFYWLHYDDKLSMAQSISLRTMVADKLCNMTEALSEHEFLKLIDLIEGIVSDFKRNGKKQKAYYWMHLKESALKFGFGCQKKNSISPHHKPGTPGKNPQLAVNRDLPHKNEGDGVFNINPIAGVNNFPNHHHSNTARPDFNQSQTLSGPLPSLRQQQLPGPLPQVQRVLMFGKNPNYLYPSPQALYIPSPVPLVPSHPYSPNLQFNYNPNRSPMYQATNSMPMPAFKQTGYNRVVSIQNIQQQDPRWTNEQHVLINTQSSNGNSLDQQKFLGWTNDQHVLNKQSPNGNMLDQQKFLADDLTTRSPMGHVHNNKEQLYNSHDVSMNDLVLDTSSYDDMEKNNVRTNNVRNSFEETNTVRNSFEETNNVQQSQNTGGGDLDLFNPRKKKKKRKKKRNEYCPKILTCKNSRNAFHNSGFTPSQVPLDEINDLNIVDSNYKPPRATGNIMSLLQRPMPKNNGDQDDFDIASATPCMLRGYINKCIKEEKAEKADQALRRLDKLCPSAIDHKNYEELICVWCKKEDIGKAEYWLYQSTKNFKMTYEALNVTIQLHAKQENYSQIEYWLMESKKHEVYPTMNMLKELMGHLILKNKLNEVEILMNKIKNIFQKIEFYSSQLFDLCGKHEYQAAHFWFQRLHKENFTPSTNQCRKMILLCLVAGKLDFAKHWFKKYPQFDVKMMKKIFKCMDENAIKELTFPLLPKEFNSDAQKVLFGLAKTNFEQSVLNQWEKDLLLYGIKDPNAAESSDQFQCAKDNLSTKKHSGLLDFNSDSYFSSFHPFVAKQNPSPAWDTVTSPGFNSSNATATNNTTHSQHKNSTYIPDAFRNTNSVVTREDKNCDKKISINTPNYAPTSPISHNLYHNDDKTLPNKEKNFDKVWSILTSTNEFNSNSTKTKNKEEENWHALTLNAVFSPENEASDASKSKSWEEITKLSIENKVHEKAAVNFIKATVTLADNQISPTITTSNETANSLDSPMTSWEPLTFNRQSSCRKWSSGVVLDFNLEQKSNVKNEEAVGDWEEEVSFQDTDSKDITYPSPPGDISPAKSSSLWTGNWNPEKITRHDNPWASTNLAWKNPSTTSEEYTAYSKQREEKKDAMYDQIHF